MVTFKQPDHSAANDNKTRAEQYRASLECDHAPIGGGPEAAEDSFAAYWTGGAWSGATPFVKGDGFQPDQDGEASHGRN